MLNVRQVGYLHNMPGDDRSPESFSFPACMTSMLESVGEDVGIRTIHAHGRPWTERFANKECLAASGMGFGLLWFPGGCPSATDLTQVHEDHNETIRRAFDWAGYTPEIVEKTELDKQEMFDKIAKSIDEGRPVLAFGIVGPPECSIVCGYDREKDSLMGWSHFQAGDAQAFAENGMFVAENWHEPLWKIVICGPKKEPRREMAEVIRHGLSIMALTQMGRYLAGAAAYEEWIAYVLDGQYDQMPEAELKDKYGLHHIMVGSHAEARCYLGNFLFDRAGGNEALLKAAQCFLDIHDTCWKVWGAAGGLGAPDGHLAFANPEKRQEIAGLLRRIQELDAQGAAALEQALARL